MKAITSHIVALLALFLLGSDALSIPLVCAQGFVYATELDLEESLPDGAPSSATSSSASEIEERQDALAISFSSLPSNAEPRDLRYALADEKTLVGVSDELIIPPNA